MKIKVSCGDTEFVCGSENITDLFYINDYIDYAPETGVLQTKTVNGKHNPVIYLRADIVDQLSL